MCSYFNLLNVAVTIYSYKFIIQKIQHGANFPLCILYGSQNKLRLLSYTAFTYCNIMCYSVRQHSHFII